MQYPVNNIYGCIQGEGCLTGLPMVMLRLHGCAVGCPWCDTKETWDIDPAYQVNNISDALGATPYYTTKSQSEIVFYLKQNYSLFNWVLISGGEPAQYDLSPLANALHDSGYKVALETSGTELGHVAAGMDWVCVSPKIDMPGGKLFLLEALSVANEIKYVIGKPADIAKLDVILSQAKIPSNCEICLQPVSQSPKATKFCIDQVQKRGWRLSIQIHKYLGVD